MIIGDGHSTILERMLTDCTLGPVLPKLISGDGQHLEGLDISQIPADGESVLLNWRHNLGQGGCPRLVTEADDRFQRLSNLAVAATRVLQIGLAAVDMVEVDGQLRVLEVNCGIMMESFARSSDENHSIAKHFYCKLVAAAIDFE